MKKHIPVVAVILFVAALLCLSNFIWMQQEARRTQAVEEAERHLQVYSSLPDDVNVDLAKMFYDRFHLRVQITTKADGDLHQSVIHGIPSRNQAADCGMVHPAGTAYVAEQRSTGLAAPGSRCVYE